MFAPNLIETPKITICNLKRAQTMNCISNINIFENERYRLQKKDDQQNGIFMIVVMVLFVF